MKYRRGYEIPRKRLARRTFMTRDTRGCSFRATACYGIYADEDRYEAMGRKASTLAELQRLVGQIA